MEMSIRFPGLKLFFGYVPRSFQIFGMEFTIYGMLIATGAILGIGLVTLEAKRSGENQNKYLDIMILSLLASVVGSRVFYVIFSWELYRENLSSILNLRNGGYAVYGGLLAGFLVADISCRVMKIDFRRMADIASMGILLGQTIGRWGNFFNRESFGEYASLPWIMQLPVSVVHSGEVSGRMRDNLLTIDGISYIQVQPVFLYESLWCLLLLLVLLALRRRKRYEGELFMIYLAGYGFGRFFFEWLRTDKLYIPGTKIGISLVISAALFIICTPAVIVHGIMSQKRAAIRKHRRGAFIFSEKESVSEENIHTDAERKNITEKPETDMDTDKSEADAEERKNADPDKKIQKEPEEMLNWEESEYAHISEQWRQNVGTHPTNSEDDR